MSSKARRIILDEVSEAEKLIREKKDRYVNFRDISLIAKYLIYKGTQRNKLKRRLQDTLASFPNFNLDLRISEIDRAIKTAWLRPIRNADYRIPITNKEWESLNELTRKEKRLMLYIIFVTKLLHYQTGNIKKPKSFSGFLNYDLRSAYYSMINSRGSKDGGISLKEEFSMLHKFFKLGLIVPTFTKTINVKCLDFNNTSKSIKILLDAKKDFREQINYIL